MELDLSKKLQITINNKKPVLLSDLTQSLLAFTQEYQKFVESEAGEGYQSAAELYIKDVRSGSIVVDLVTNAMPIVPLLWQGGSLTEWVEATKGITNWLLGKASSAPKDLTKNDMKNWHSIVEPIAKDGAAQMNVTVTDNGKVINQFFLNSQQANAIQNSIRRQIEKIEAPDDHIRRRKVMYWYQSRFDAESHTGDKAIIEDISKKGVKVIFENNAVKEAMLSGDPKFDKPWHKLAYVVDVQVQTIDGVPKLYTVLKYYPEYTFDPDE